MIALVITIIVLLILAAISITTLTDNHSIIKNAIEAKERTEIAEIIEKAQIDIVGVQSGNKGDITEEQINEILNQYGEIAGEGENRIITTDKGYKIKVTDIWKGNPIKSDPEANGISAKDIANSTDKREYYGAIVTGYECTNSEAVENWKIFYADEQHIYLIADDYISYLYAPDGRNGTKITKNSNDYRLSFNDVIADYPDGSAHVTNTKLQELNSSYFQYLTDNGTESNTNNSKAVAYLLDTEVWSVYKGEKAEYAIGGPTVEMLMKSYSQKHNLDYQARAKSDIGYEISTNGGKNWRKHLLWDIIR